MVKKAYLRTAEAVIAVVLTFVMITVMIDRETVTQTIRSPENVLDILKDNPDFRACVQSLNHNCINQTLDEQIPDSYDFVYTLSADPNAPVSGLPEKRVYANAVMLTGNTTDSTTQIIRLFYWTKE
ncbi:hypothetical protein JXB11_00470 [Candidatus Woesearchaeota archaeon]|nr:hypothetical protein [Candidatus Woesearchaeota archaeon]